MFTLDPFTQSDRHFVSNMPRADRALVEQASAATGGHVEWSDTPNNYADPATHGSINSNADDLKEFWAAFRAAKEG